MARNLIGAIDQGTSSSRFLVFDAQNEAVVAQHQIEFKSIYPKEGWAEQNPWDLVDTVKSCIQNVYQQLKEKGLQQDMKAIGITNQRETTVVWSKKTGKPLYNAIVWLDARTQETVETLKDKAGPDGEEKYRKKTGLPISTYFSAIKLRWMLDNVPDVKKSMDDGDLCFGTVDSWLLWNLTGKFVHVTDVTNASRTMLMDLNSLKWDENLINFIGIDRRVLPEIKSSSEIYGNLAYKDSPWPDVPISGCLGDQQAALVGQKCLAPGMAKNTYGTGCFMLYNVGDKIVHSNHGLLSTVAYQMGQKKPVYALEGSIAIAGAAVSWLRDNMGIIKTSSEIEDLARKVDDCGGCQFVPALSGLFAPHWRPDARGVILGLTQFTRKEHLCRATLEAVCFQTREILEAMTSDSGLMLEKLLVDGGMTKNELMMQIQADFLDIEVIRPSNVETTSLGAAIAAASALGITMKSENSSTSISYHAKMAENLRNESFSKWKKAVLKCF